MVDKELEEARKGWMEMHKRQSSPDRLRRLEGSLYLETEFLEKIWWPAIGSLEDLHPEYEVRDYNDGRRFIDHAYKPDGVRLALEADGFNPHIRDIDRWDHADNLLRDKHLIADGWTVIHYSSDVIRYRSRQAQQLLRQIVWGREGRLDGEEFPIEERETIRFGKRKGGPVTPSEVGAYLGRTRGVSANILRSLVRKQIYRPVNPDSKQIRSYVLTKKGRDIWL